MRPTALALSAALVLVTGCGGSTGSSADGPGPDPVTASPTAGGSGADRTAGDTRPRVVGTAAENLAVPWGIAFLPDGSALVTERDTGRVLHLTGRSIRRHITAVGRIRAAGVQGGEAGLLGVAVSPAYRTNHRVFFYASTTHDNRILRATFRHGHLSATTPILTGIPHGVIHDGGRLAFGPDGRLYASTGETGQGDLAQDPKSLGGKILRITEGGDPAPGNPDPRSPVWTLGHRNVQGLAFDPAGRLWASEFGDQTWDELNLIRKGGNYGWPRVEGRSTLARFRNPLAVWHTDQASPSGLAFADGSLWLGALHGARLWQVRLHGASIDRPRDWFVGKYGRMRTVVRAPSGNLWVTTSNKDGRGSPARGDDRILVIRP